MVTVASIFSGEKTEAMGLRFIGAMPRLSAVGLPLVDWPDNAFQQNLTRSLQPRDTPRGLLKSNGNTTFIVIINR